MKKLTAMILALALALSFTLCGSAAGSDWADYTCVEEQFSTKIPVSGTSGYVEGSGLTIYTDVAGYIPYIIVHRRPMDKKFSNPVNYLNNVYREHMENKYGDQYLGMIGTARTREIGGKELLSAEYRFSVSGRTVVQLQLIDIRDAGDVEYTVKFIQGEDEATMAALNEAVRYYRETDTGTQAKPAAEKEVLRPVDISGMGVDTTDGIYYTRIRDAEKVDSGGYFTAELYLPDTYPLDEVYALQEGDRVEVNGTVWTVASLLPEEDGRRELRVKEAIDGYIVFKKETDISCTVLVNDWAPCTMISTEKIMLPLRNDFSFAWMSPDGEAQVYDADSFIKLLRDGDTERYLTQYNTMLRYKDGLLGMIVHADYPEGPEEEAGETVPDTGSADAGEAEAPLFLTPSVFVSYFNGMMIALADQYAEALGEEGVAIVKEGYVLTEEDFKGQMVYYDNPEWTVEAGFMFEDEVDFLVNAPALSMTFSIRNDLPDGAVYLSRAALKMVIAYHSQDRVSYTDLSEWFDTVDDPSDIFPLSGGWTLNYMQAEGFTKYAVLPPDSMNPYAPGNQP